ncbi:MAG: LLM class F420-dependent oxidoreductase [Acidimicrobiales bacterium]|nr:LLM class F420-dependent oxidoreductase [Acidimicrobiales bacterium]
MHFGATIFPTADAMHPADLGRALEERGFESLWVAEHTHIPASRKSPWPGGAELPQMYYETMDPFVALTAAATATTTLKVATGITLVPQHHPITLAKQVASLDQVSGGRFILGVGGGWNAEEMENHGGDFSTRWKLMRERIEAMKAIWADDPAEYHGELVDFDPIWSKPKPVQTPHPPIHVGGGSPSGPRRAARYGNGWMPIHGRGSMLDELDVLATECEKNGRDVAEIELSLYAAPPDPAVVETHEAAGVSRFIFGLPPAGEDVLLPLLDDYAAVIETSS